MSEAGLPFFFLLLAITFFPQRSKVQPSTHEACREQEETFRSFEKLSFYPPQRSAQRSAAQPDLKMLRSSEFIWFISSISQISVISVRFKASGQSKINITARAWRGRGRIFTFRVHLEENRACRLPVGTPFHAVYPIETAILRFPRAGHPRPCPPEPSPISSRTPKYG